MTEWFRSWHGAPTDPKWLGIAKRSGVAPGIAVAVAWALMDRASQAADRGSIDGYDAEGLRESPIAMMAAKGHLEPTRSRPRSNFADCGNPLVDLVRGRLITPASLSTAAARGSRSPIVRLTPGSSFRSAANCSAAGTTTSSAE